MFNNYLRLSTLSAEVLNCRVPFLPGCIFKPTGKEAIDSLLIHSIISSGTRAFFLSTRKASDNASEMVCTGYDLEGISVSLKVCTGYDLDPGRPKLALDGAHRNV
jgi:hypothetical protein